MATSTDLLKPWIAQTIIKHDKKHGANTDVRVEKSVYCQLTRFDVVRTKENPRAKVEGIAADKTHHVKVIFDETETDKFEAACKDLEADRLSSHLRAIFMLESFYIHLQPRGYPADLPVVCLVVLKWSVSSGDRSCPEHNVTDEIGMGYGDDEVRGVLRKWWSGVSNSGTSKTTPAKPQPKPDSSPSVAPPPKFKPINGKGKGNAPNQPKSNGTANPAAITVLASEEDVKQIKPWMIKAMPHAERDRSWMGREQMEERAEPAREKAASSTPVGNTAKVAKVWVQTAGSSGSSAQSLRKAAQPPLPQTPTAGQASEQRQGEKAVVDGDGKGKRRAREQQQRPASPRTRSNSPVASTTSHTQKTPVPPKNPSTKTPTPSQGARRSAASSGPVSTPKETRPDSPPPAHTPAEVDPTPPSQQEAPSAKAPSPTSAPQSQRIVDPLAFDMSPGSSYFERELKDDLETDDSELSDYERDRRREKKREKEKKERRENGAGSQTSDDDDEEDEPNPRSSSPPDRYIPSSSFSASSGSRPSSPEILLPSQASSSMPDFSPPQGPPTNARLKWASKRPAPMPSHLSLGVFGAEEDPGEDAQCTPAGNKRRRIGTTPPSSLPSQRSQRTPPSSLPSRRSQRQGGVDESSPLTETGTVVPERGWSRSPPSAQVEMSKTPLARESVPIYPSLPQSISRSNLAKSDPPASKSQEATPVAKSGGVMGILGSLTKRFWRSQGEKEEGAKRKVEEDVEMADPLVPSSTSVPASPEDHSSSSGAVPLAGDGDVVMTNGDVTGSEEDDEEADGNLTDESWMVSDEEEDQNLEAKTWGEKIEEVDGEVEDEEEEEEEEGGEEVVEEEEEEMEEEEELGEEEEEEKEEEEEEEEDDYEDDTEEEEEEEEESSEDEDEEEEPSEDEKPTVSPKPRHHTRRRRPSPSPPRALLLNTHSTLSELASRTPKVSQKKQVYVEAEQKARTPRQVKAEPEPEREPVHAVESSQKRVDVKANGRGRPSAGQEAAERKKPTVTQRRHTSPPVKSEPAESELGFQGRDPPGVPKLGGFMPRMTLERGLSVRAVERMMEALRKNQEQQEARRRDRSG